MIIKKMLDEEYFSFKAISASVIKEIYNDPELFCYNLKKGIKKDSKSMRIGSLVHCLMLEPEEFDKRYLAVSSSAATKAYKDAVKEFPEKTIITVPEHVLALEILESNKNVAEIFSITENEQAIVGEIEVLNKKILAKGKVDALLKNNDKYLIYDLKTTSDLEWFDRDAIKYGYHIQAGFYKWLCDTALPDHKFYGYNIIALETKPPFKARLYECTPKFVHTGKQIAYETIFKHIISNNIFEKGYVRPHLEPVRLKLNVDDSSISERELKRQLASLNF